MMGWPKGGRWVVVAALALLCVGRVAAQVATVAAGAPAWARSAVNLEFHPIEGVTKIAYVAGASGSDGSGEVYTYHAADGDYRRNPNGVATFATGDAAIAAVGRDGANAVLFDSAYNGVVHETPVVNGGCQGLSAAHPFLFGAYFSAGPGATVESNMALFAPSPGAHAGNDFLFSVQRSNGFSNLIIENIKFTLPYRVWGDPQYDEDAAIDTANNWGAIRIYGNSTNVLLRNIKVDSCSEGITIEGQKSSLADEGVSTPTTRLKNVVLDNVKVIDVWATGSRYEGLFMSYLQRPRILNSAVVGCGYFRHNTGIDDGNETEGTNQGVYLSFVEEPWVDNSFFYDNSHAGVQARCGGTVTRSIFGKNCRNLSFGHGQNKIETNTPAAGGWHYDCVVRDILVDGSRDIGDGSGLALGGGLELGRVRSADFQRFVVVGNPVYSSTDATFGINIGNTPAGTGIGWSIGPGVVDNWNPSGVSAAGGLSFQGFAAGVGTGAQVTFTGLRIHDQRGALVYAQGDQTITRVRIGAATYRACRRDKTGTAATYGPSGTAPTAVTNGGVDGYVARPTTAWRGLVTELGFADEAAMVAAFTTPGGSWDARRALNKVFPLYGFNTLPTTNAAAANQAATGVSSN